MPRAVRSLSLLLALLALLGFGRAGLGLGAGPVYPGEDSPARHPALTQAGHAPETMLGSAHFVLDLSYQTYRAPLPTGASALRSPCPLREARSAAPQRSRAHRLGQSYLDYAELLKRQHSGSTPQRSTAPPLS